MHTRELRNMPVAVFHYLQETSWTEVVNEAHIKVK